jgi:4-diphosphocytidyl-2C-methyl-D-erythritol kinase
VLPGHPLGVEAANDLERGVFARHPALARARDDLRRAGAAVALMSGSGSAVFGLFTDRRQAARALARLTRPGWTGVLTRTIGRAVARPRVRHIVS